MQIIISDLIGPEQNYAVKGRLIQDNFRLVHKVVEGLKDGIDAVLINLDQAKVFDRMDHRLCGDCLETAGFKPEFYKWISKM